MEIEFSGFAEKKPELYSDIMLTRCRCEKKKKKKKTLTEPVSTQVNTHKTHLRWKHERNERDWMITSEFRLRSLSVESTRHKRNFSMSVSNETQFGFWRRNKIQIYFNGETNSRRDPMHAIDIRTFLAFNNTTRYSMRYVETTKRNVSQSMGRYFPVIPSRRTKK